MDIAIRYEHIGMAYGNKKVIEDLNLSVENGEFVTIVGSSGGGKTTILKMVNGLNIPTEGDIYIHGENIKSKDIIELRRNIGYAIQGNVLFPNMTIEENIAYVPTLINKKDKERTKGAVDKWMKITNLDPEMLIRYPDELSGGQQQRVGIARSLAASPDILLMDEPFGALDAITREQLQEEIKDIHIKTGITVMFVTHDISEALKLGTKVLVIDNGKVHQYGTPAELLEHPATEFVQQLVERESRKCDLPYDNLHNCEHCHINTLEKKLKVQ